MKKLSLFLIILLLLLPACAGKFKYDISWGKLPKIKHIKKTKPFLPVAAVQPNTASTIAPVKVKAKTVSVASSAPVYPYVQGYGEISKVNGLPRTNIVSGYYRRDGTYVRSYARSR